MNLQDLVQDNYARANTTWGPSYLDTIKYIETMAKNFKKDPAKVPIAPFLTTTGAPLTQKNEINKILSSLTSEQVVAASTFKLKPEIAKTIDKLMNTSSELKKLQQSADQARDRARTYANSMAAELKNLREQQKKIDSYNEVLTDKYSKDIEKILSEGFFTLNEADLGSSYIEFKTANEITLSHVNKSAGIDTSVVLGKYRVRINPSNFGLSVSQLENNIKAHGKYHPHVSSDGSVCWGNASDMYAKAVSTGNVYAILKLTQEILSGYWDDNPFVALQEFEVAREVANSPCKSALTMQDGGSRLTNYFWSKTIRTAQQRIIEQSKGTCGVKLSDLKDFFTDIVNNLPVRWENGAITKETPDPTKPMQGVMNMKGLKFLARASDVEVDIYTNNESDEIDTIYQDYQGQRIHENGEPWDGDQDDEGDEDDSF